MKDALFKAEGGRMRDALCKAEGGRMRDALCKAEGGRMRDEVIAHSFHPSAFRPQPFAQP